MDINLDGHIVEPKDRERIECQHCECGAQAHYCEYIGPRPYFFYSCAEHTKPELIKRLGLRALREAREKRAKSAEKACK